MVVFYYLDDKEVANVPDAAVPTEGELVTLYSDEQPRAVIGRGRVIAREWTIYDGHQTRVAVYLETYQRPYKPAEQS